MGLFFVCALPARADFISEVLDDSPDGFWLLNDSGSTAFDSSANAFHGTFGLGITQQGIAGPAWASGFVADFNGGNISFPTYLDLGGFGFTIQAWINPTALSLTQTTRIVASGSGFDGYGFGTAAGGELLLTQFTVQDYFSTSLNLLPNQWYYVGVVVDADNDAHFYVNGAFMETVEGSAQSLASLQDFTIGNQSPGLGHTDEIYRGGLAGVSVYKTPLSATQIQEQYNAAIPEPSSALLVGGGCVLLLRRRKAGGSVSC